MTATTTDDERPPTTASALTTVDPRAPRFGQAITATGLAVGIVAQQPLLVVAVAAILVTSVVSRWRLNLYAVVWRRVVLRVVGAPSEREPASPHRFATLMGAAFTGVAGVALLAGTAGGVGGLVLAGYALAVVVAVLAGVAAAFDVCVGCRMYAQVAFFRRVGWV